MIFEGTKNKFFFGLGLTRAGKSVPDEASLRLLYKCLDIDNNDKKEIKVVAETEHYILTVARNRENSEGIYLSVTTGKDKLDMLPDVYVKQDYKGKCEKVDINWSAMGNCSVAETEAFINALKEAIEFAKQIEGKDFSNEI